jgi:uncharacterized repeat protein (TIGR01451 family)
MGQSMVEFALLLPLFLVVCALAIDVGRLFYSYVAVVNAAKEGAAYGGRNPICATNTNSQLCPDPNNVTWRVTNEASNLSGLTAPVIECISALTDSPYTDLKDCKQDDTYHVRTSYAFKLITPILSSVFGSSLTLQANATSPVLNLAFDPTPGASLTKYACFGAGCTPAVTPLLDANNNSTYQEGNAGAQIKYQITVTNVGGQTLTGLTLTDTNLSLPFGTANCPSLPTSFAVAATWQCTYTLTAPNTNGQLFLLYSNTATLNADQIQQRQAVATVKIDALPPGLSVAKYVSPYKLGGNGAGPWGTSPTTTVSYNGRTGTTSATVWYQLTVSNPGGSATTGVIVTDKIGASSVLPAFGTDCPTPPTSLAAGQSWKCLYSAQYPSAFTSPVANVATATSSNAGTQSGTATVTVTQCSGPSLVVPMLIGLTKAGAGTAWANAGFSAGNLTTWTGHTSDPVVAQDVQANSCVSPTTTMTVSR